MELVYQIESTNDRLGNKKEIPNEWKLQQYIIYSLSVGHSAMLPYADNSGRGLRTSTVEDISMFNNKIKITTRNTVYYLKPILRGDSDGKSELL